jgi:hypothetical protein
VWHENVLLKDRIHFGVSLGATAPGLDFISVLFVDVGIKDFSGFAHNEGLLVLEVVTVLDVKMSFDGVLGLGLGLFMDVLLLEEE